MDLTRDDYRAFDELCETVLPVCESPEEIEEVAETFIDTIPFFPE